MSRSDVQLHLIRQLSSLRINLADERRRRQKSQFQDSIKVDVRRADGASEKKEKEEIDFISIFIAKVLSTIKNGHKVAAKCMQSDILERERVVVVAVVSTTTATMLRIQ